MSEELVLDLVRRVGLLETENARLRQEIKTHRHHRDPRWDLWLRGIDRAGRATYTDHFRSGTIPTGFSWITDGTFNGTPAALDYDYRGTYLQVVSDDTPHYLRDAISTYEDKSIFARLHTSRVTEIGVRLDDGSDNNYAEIILDPDDVGAYNVDFRYRAGGGGVTDVAGPLYPATEYVVVELNWYSVAPAAYAYVVGEAGRRIGVTSFNTGALGWTPARVGIKVQVDGGEEAHVDWFYSTFS